MSFNRIWETEKKTENALLVHDRKCRIYTKGFLLCTIQSVAVFLYIPIYFNLNFLF